MIRRLHLEVDHGPHQVPVEAPVTASVLPQVEDEGARGARREGPKDPFGELREGLSRRIADLFHLGIHRAGLGQLGQREGRVRVAQPERWGVPARRGPQRARKPGAGLPRS